MEQDRADEFSPRPKEKRRGAAAHSSLPAMRGVEAPEKKFSSGENRGCPVPSIRRMGWPRSIRNVPIEGAFVPNVPI